MHELNLCISLIQTIEENVEKLPNDFHRVKKIWVEVGMLAGIELDALQFSFPIAAKGTIAENAILEIISVEGEAWCKKCQEDIFIKTYFSSCSKCNCYDYRLTKGKEFRLLKLGVV